MLCVVGYSVVEIICDRDVDTQCTSMQYKKIKLHIGTLDAI